MRLLGNQHIGINSCIVYETNGLSFLFAASTFSISQSLALKSSSRSEFRIRWWPSGMKMYRCGKCKRYQQDNTGLHHPGELQCAIIWQYQNRGTESVGSSIVENTFGFVFTSCQQRRGWSKMILSEGMEKSLMESTIIAEHQHGAHVTSNEFLTKAPCSGWVATFVDDEDVFPLNSCSEVNSLVDEIEFIWSVITMLNTSPSTLVNRQWTS